MTDEPKTTGPASGYVIVDNRGRVISYTFRELMNESIEMFLRDYQPHYDQWEHWSARGFTVKPATSSVSLADGES